MMNGYCYLALLSLTLACPQAAAQGAVDLGAPDPTKVVGPDSCAKCHGAELAQWKQTPHAQTFEQLHRLPEAKAIADRLGGGSIKRNDTCVECHYTQQQVRGRDRVVAGVSCESCHGAARDWLEMHADYGGAGITRETESPAHRQQRRDRSIAAGMNNPSNLYLVARQCLSCHTAPNERLVNVGGHKPGTTDFELVSWSQGKVRHNFLSGAGQNAPSPLPRIRLMYVVGLMADLEMSLRATAGATEAATFGQTAAARAADRKQRLWEVQRRLNDPRVAAALAPLADLELRLGAGDEIRAAADAVGAAAFEFARDADGAQMQAIDDLLPPPSSYKY
ncbi:cytochrome c family protein [Pirellulimonas nuda]|nr:cytochrome c family protein [Pirellulimonas nuda]